MANVIQDTKSEAAKWIAEIKLYERESGPWQEKTKKIVSRYKDQRNQQHSSKARYNILWSNVQTLIPALYAQNPKPNVERRFQDDDELSLKASQVLERCISYFVREDDVFSVNRQAVIDRLLGGRGTVWVRYVPNMSDPTIQGTQEIKEEGLQTTDDALTVPELKSEEVRLDYINWTDFGHTWARTWEEVRAIWKKVYLTREEGVKRFGDVFKSIPLDYSPEKLNDEKVQDTLKKATVYEIWDKTEKKVIWLHKDWPELLETAEDPLRLKNFFPGPKPLYATLANDTIIPVPDYTEYQDQAMELDQLTGRINSITKSIKVAGVYDSSAEGVQRLMVEGIENQLISVSNWAVFSEKGGLKGVIDLLPMQDIAATLLSLYEARDKVKQDLYEISGISDIVRGATNANETATAQKIKGQFATLRLDSMQKDVESFARDEIRIMGEIIAEHFSLETIKNISGIRLPTTQEKMMFEQQAQMMQNPEAQPVDEKTQEFMSLPTWEDVYGLLKNDALRSFRIDVETDSTIKMDQDAERDARMEFLGAAGGFIQQMTQVQNPEVMPLLLEMLQFGVRGFKVGKDLEATFKTTIDKIKKAAENPQPPPDPMQAEKEMEGMRLETQKQIEGVKIQSNEQIEGQKIASNERIEFQKDQSEKEREHIRVDGDVKKSRFDAKTKVSPDQAMSDDDLNEGPSPLTIMVQQMAQMMDQQSQGIMQGLQNIAQIQAQGNQAVIQAIQNPPPRIVERDAQGRVKAVV